MPGWAVAQELWTVTPSLEVAEAYTDNVFGTAHARESDFTTQITPGLGLSYETPRVKLSLGYKATAEFYADHSDLDNFGENQNGILTWDYRPDDRLHLRLAAFYDRTNNPSNLLVTPAVTPAAPPGTVVVPTVEISRRETTQVTASAGGDYRFTPRFSGRAGYDFAFLKQEGTADSFSHTGSLGGDYQLTREDEGFSTASVSYFDSTDTVTSASLLLGWRRQWSPDFRTSVAAGPRITDSTWGAAADASATYRAGREWDLSLAYSFGTGLAAGTTGAQNISALTAAIDYHPLRDLRFRASGGWTRAWAIEGTASEGTRNAYFAGVSAIYQFTRWLALALGYRYTLEEHEHADSIPTNQVTLALTAAYPWVLPR